MNFTLHDITRITGGELHGALEITVTGVFTDSRRAGFNPNDVFAALVGPRHDGHDYIPVLIEKGVRVFLVSNSKVVTQNAAFVVVEDTLKALQQLAAAHRHRLSIPFLAVTGSNGKTMVKEWTSRLAAKQMPVGKSPKSYNSQVGVPLSVFEIGERHKAAIIEAGISQPGEMDNLHEMIKPQFCVFTTIGEAHDEFFSSREEKIDEKCKLFRGCQKVVYHIAERDVYNGLIKVCDRKDLVSCGISNPDADVNVEHMLESNGNTHVRLSYYGENYEFTLPFTGRYFVMNALQSFTAAVLLGCDPQKVCDAMPGLKGLEMRLEMKRGLNNCTVINDSYSLDFHSLSLALNFLKQQSGNRPKVVVLSDFPQTGMPGTEWVKKASDMCKRAGVSQFIGVGPVFKKYADTVEIDHKEFFDSTNSLLKVIRERDFSGKFLLLKGGRKFRFERLDAEMQARVHHTSLQIDMQAIIHNLNAYRSLLNNNEKIMVMVKAAAYGSGIEQTGILLQHHRVDYLGVAFADEGIRLRDAGVQLPIMVISPEVNRFDAVIRYRLEPEIYSLNGFEKFVRALEKHEEAIRPYPIHIKWETGMNRLGFSDADLPSLIDRICAHPEVEIKGMLSHLAASDEPDNDDFSINQIRKFKRAAEALQSQTGQKPILHIANTSAVSRLPESRLDMVRLGLGLYGITGDAKMKKKLLPAGKFTSHIVQIKHLKPGDTVGYGRREKITRDTVIATVNVGYADGLRRGLSNRKGQLFVNGMAAPIVGNICMDICMIDITEHPDAKVGDEVEIFGDRQNVEEIARLLDTIPYEILTGVSSRVRRIYVD